MSLVEKPSTIQCWREVAHNTLRARTTNTRDLDLRTALYFYVARLTIHGKECKVHVARRHNRQPTVTICNGVHYLLWNAYEMRQWTSLTQGHQDYSPEAEGQLASRWDADEGVLSGGVMEVGFLGVGKESVGPPNLVQHLVADTQCLSVIKLQSLICPVLAEVDFCCEVLDIDIPRQSLNTLGLRENILPILH